MKFVFLEVWVQKSDAEMQFCQFTWVMVLLLLHSLQNWVKTDSRFPILQHHKNVTNKYVGSVYLLEYMVQNQIVSAFNYSCDSVNWLIYLMGLEIELWSCSMLGIALSRRYTLGLVYLWINLKYGVVF